MADHLRSRGEGYAREQKGARPPGILGDVSRSEPGSGFGSAHLRDPPLLHAHLTPRCDGRVVAFRGAQHAACGRRGVWVRGGVLVSELRDSLGKRKGKVRGLARGTAGSDSEELLAG